MTAPEQPTRRTAILLAFAAVFIVWGSVYLAIKFAIESLPPLLMVGWRLALAGVLLYAWARWRGSPNPTGRHWAHAVLIGLLVLTFGAGAVAWAQQHVPSGLTALLIATEPFWMVLLDWWWFGGPRPRLGVAAGILIGFAGAAFLAAPGGWGGSVGLDPVGCAVILLATIFWAVGSLHSRSAPQPPSLLQAASMQMIAGGLLLLAAGTLLGEWSRADLAAVSLKSWLAFAYLLLFASLITFPAYIWLLQKVSAAQVAVYAYVNPVVALLLGWALAGEELTPAALVASAVILLGVVLVVSSSRPGRPHSARLHCPAADAQPDGNSP